MLNVRHTINEKSCDEKKLKAFYTSRLLCALCIYKRVAFFLCFCFKMQLMIIRINIALETMLKLFYNIYFHLLQNNKKKESAVTIDVKIFVRHPFFLSGIPLFCR